MADAFELLRRLKDLSEEAGPSIRAPRTQWWIDYHGIDRTLRIEIPLTEDEAEFIEQMRLMFAPVDEVATKAPRRRSALIAIEQVVAEADSVLRGESGEAEERHRRRGVEAIKALDKVMREEAITSEEGAMLDRKRKEIGRVVFGVDHSESEGGQ